MFSLYFLVVDVSWGSAAFGVWRLLLTLLKANDSDSRSMKDLPCLNCKWIEVRSPPSSRDKNSFSSISPLHLQYISHSCHWADVRFLFNYMVLKNSISESESVPLQTKSILWENFGLSFNNPSSSSKCSFSVQIFKHWQFEHIFVFINQL